MMKLYGKKILILGGAAVHCKVVEAAKRLGVYTVVTDYLDDSPAKAMADEKIMLSIVDVDGIVDYCKNNTIDGVINYCNDPAQKAHQAICERLRLPCFGTAEQVATFTDKRTFKMACLECGVSVVPSYSETDIINDESNIKYPVLIKPADSRGSRGQTICNSRDESIKGIKLAKKESFSGNIIIEKYMRNCDDLQLVYLVVNGKPMLVKVEDRYLGDAKDNLDRLCIATICPSVHEEEYREKVNEKVVAMIEKLGIKNGPVFMQGFWENDDVLFYDPGIRFPGDGFEYLYFKATGIDLPQLLIKYALTGSFPADTASKVNSARIRNATAMILPCLRPGRIVEIRGLESIISDPRILNYVVEYRVGDIVGEHNNCKQRFGEFDIACDTFQDLQTAIDDLFENIKVLDENGEDMIIAKFNTQHVNFRVG